MLIASAATVDAPVAAAPVMRPLWRACGDVGNVSRSPESDAAELERLVITLEGEMYAAAEELRFESAAKLRDEIKELRRELQALAVWLRPRSGWGGRGGQPVVGPSTSSTLRLNARGSTAGKR
jgi:hypothetical protein